MNWVKKYHFCVDVPFEWPIYETICYVVYAISTLYSTVERKHSIYFFPFLFYDFWLFVVLDFFTYSGTCLDFLVWSQESTSVLSILHSFYIIAFLFFFPAWLFVMDKNQKQKVLEIVRNFNSKFYFKRFKILNLYIIN